MIPKTPTKGAARKEDTISPDPLAMQNKSISDEEEDMIVIPSRNPPSSKKVIARATSLRKRKAQQSDDELQEPDEKPIKRTKRIDVTVEIPLPKSRSRTSPKPDNEVELPTTPRKVGRPSKNTPQTARASSSRSKPVPATSGSTTEEQVRTPSTRVRKPTAKAREGSSTPRPKTVLPTTPKKVETRAEHPESVPGSGSGSSDDSSEEDDEDNFKLDDEHSRAKFLHNERRRKANQARNFVYTGDATEKRRLRNGKAVQEEEESVPDDMPADDVRVLYQEVGFQRDGDGIDFNMDEEMDYTYIPQTMVLPEIPLSAPSSIHKASTLSTYARTALNEILTRISAPTSRNPPPFATEGPENEALTNLVNLLRGTVERGEGNSCLVVGSKGNGKTRTVNRAINIVQDSIKQQPGKKSLIGGDESPIVVRLDGLAQINDMLAIREMGRQIAEQEGQEEADDEEDTDLAVDASAPTTLPSHLLTYLTASSSRSIIVVIEGFDLFTEHARQALLYCLLDVVQSVRTGPVESTGRGVAVIGVTSRVDTPLLLEKRVKSRFSQRIFRVASPLSTSSEHAWSDLLSRALTLPEQVEGSAPVEPKDEIWAGTWNSSIETVLLDEKVISVLDRLCSLSTDPRVLYQPFVRLISEYVQGPCTHITADMVTKSINDQIESTGWGRRLEQLHGLSQPDLVLLIIAKHFAYAGKEEFNLAMAEHEYLRFARTELAASGRTKWSSATLQAAWEHLLAVGLIFPATRFKPSTNPHMQKFIICRSLLTRSEIIGFFKGEGGKMLGTELANWGRMAGGYA